jgi:hypothetical protein
MTCSSVCIFFIYGAPGRHFSFNADDLNDDVDSAAFAVTVSD